MGRPFLVEFYGIDSGKFYICRMCRTPFARNIDAYHCSKWGEEADGDFTYLSYMLRIANIVDSGNIRVVRNYHQEYYLQEIHCISCNNQVGFKFKDLGPWPMYEMYSLDSAYIWYLINDEDHDPMTVSFEDWSDQPLPPPGDGVQTQ